MVQAHLAKDKKAFEAALLVADEAENFVGPVSSQNFLFFTGLNEGRYLLDRAVTLVESPIKELRRPREAQEFLDLAIVENKVSGKKGKMVKAYHQVDYVLIQARIYCDEGRHPTAAVTAEEVLKTLDKIHSKVGLYKVAALIKDIRKCDPYGEAVMSLQRVLLRTQHPHVYG